MWSSRIRKILIKVTSGQGRLPSVLILDARGDCGASAEGETIEEGKLCDRWAERMPLPFANPPLRHNFKWKLPEMEGFHYLVGSKEVQASSGEGFTAVVWSMVALLELGQTAQARQKPPAQGRGHTRLKGPFSGQAPLLPAPTTASGSYPEASRMLGFSGIFLLDLPSLL